MSDDRTDEAATERSIPYPRFVEVYDSRKALQAQHESTLVELTALQEEIGPLRTRVGRLSEDLALSRSGVQGDEAAAIARALHAALPEEGRPSLGDWVRGFGDENPAPRGLAVYLEPATPATPATPTPVQPVPSRQPGANSGPTADQIRRASAAASASGDWTAFNELVAAMGRSIR